MSKLLDQYKKLKEKDENIIYLFKSGIFYIALDRDAEFLSDSIGLKLTHFNEETQKCGFPITRIEYYEKIFKIGNINYELVDTTSSTSNSTIKTDKKLISIIKKIENIDFDNITYKQAFKILEETSNKIKQLNI